MKHYIIVHLLLMLILIGCSNDDTEENLQIEGSMFGYLFLSNEDQLMIKVFVEDNLFGRTLKLNYWDEVPKDYETEAYRLIITEETEVFLGDTEEKIELIPLNYETNVLHLGTKLVATLDNPLERSSTQRKRYILGEDALFPIYLAKELRVYEQTKKEFVSMNSPYKRDEYLLLSVFDSDGEEAWETYMELEEFLYSTSPENRLNIQSWFQSTQYSDIPVDQLEIETFPTYLLLSDRGIDIQTTDQQELIAHLEALMNDNEEEQDN